MTHKKYILIVLFTALIFSKSALASSELIVCKAELNELNSIHIAFDSESKDVFINEKFNQKNPAALKFRPVEQSYQRIERSQNYVRYEFSDVLLWGSSHFGVLKQDRSGNRTLSVYPSEGASYLVASGVCEVKKYSEVEIAE